MTDLLRTLNARFVQGWASAWRWWSVRLHVIATAAVALLLLVPSMPAEVQALVPPAWRAVAIGLWLIAGLLVRVWKQNGNG